MVQFEKIREDVSGMSIHDRALLAKQLIESLDEEEDADAELAWIEEAHRRLKGYTEGKVKGIPSKQVFEEARSRFR